MKKTLCPVLLIFVIVCTAGAQPSDLRMDVAEIAHSVLRWQTDNLTVLEEGDLHHGGIASWTNAAFYVGADRWLRTCGDPDSGKRLYDIGVKAGWRTQYVFKDYPRYGIYHADELCAGQFYLSMYEKYRLPEMMRDTRERADRIMAGEPDTSMDHRNKQVWTWCDALFMAPPVYAHLAAITNDARYLDYMDGQFKKTYDHLYDQEEDLFFRDDSYFEKREANGRKIFWGRGNGWVVAGLANLLRLIPEDSDYYPFYKELFVEMAERLSPLQDGEGYWHASLLDPESYPAPETSATAMIVYALAYGINNDILDRETYLSTVLRGWDALVRAVDDDGKLCYVQPIGADPKTVTRDMTANYGVGAFLLAASEIYNMKNVWN